MDLSIIIVNYQTAGLLKRCLRGIVAVPTNLEREIIVVDNDTHDGLRDMVTQEFPQVQFIVSPGNVGFGAGANIGMRLAQGRHMAIVNPDTVVLEPVFDQLVAYLDSHADVGIVGPQIVNPNGTIQTSCYRFHTPLVPAYRRTALGKTAAGERELAAFLMNDFDHASERDVDWLLGACLVVRQSVIDEIGLFDEQFFLYFEDTDWCRRAWEHGHRVVYQPAARIIHYHRRESADGTFFENLMKPATRFHVASWLRYLWKYRRKPLPRRDDRDSDRDRRSSAIEVNSI